MRSNFTRQWITKVSIGEAAGFAIAAGTGIMTILLYLELPWSLVLIVLAGAVEGAALATGQYLAMHEHRPKPGPWIGGTAAAASFAWLLGMLPSILELQFDSVATILLVVLGGLVLLGSIPFAQWLVMRRRGTFRWVPINMGAWLVAILWTAAPSPFIDESSPIALVATLYLLAGILMAVTIASITAPVARQLFGRSEPSRDWRSRMHKRAAAECRGP
ncbi:hypothetical protein [Gulosibacter molinativorax]|uniref:HdeD family acid-resistance protein n=1 Tax=Gulosibacter molinativorax TaxID=256821 RepID=A0ABT7C9H4_9MICO|nr:hypothetical protein [Gulosibacter molinativorax]MDJ1371858.1 hypothetical protein [Gulosibacter molinativorax]QUY62507.1 Hypothetical protein GMOLON4_1807 [Gulosibacter molinativorax]